MKLLRAILIHVLEILWLPIRIVGHVFFMGMCVYYMIKEHFTIKECWDIWLDIQEQTIQLDRLFIETGRFSFEEEE